MMNEQYSGAISTFNSKLNGRLKENIVGLRKKRMLSSILKKYNNGKRGCGKKDGKGGLGLLKKGIKAIGDVIASPDVMASKQVEEKANNDYRDIKIFDNLQRNSKEKTVGGNYATPNKITRKGDSFTRYGESANRMEKILKERNYDSDEIRKIIDGERFEKHSLSKIIKNKKSNDGKGGIIEDLGKLKSTSYAKIKKALKDAKRNISDNVSSMISKPSTDVRVDRVAAKNMIDTVNEKYATDKAMDEGATILKFKNKGDKNPKKYSSSK